MEENLQEEPKSLTPGEILRNAREEMGLTLNEVAAKLNLRPGLVRDLEENRFVSKNSVETFIRGYIRNYAKLLKLSEKDVIAAYDDMSGKKTALMEEAKQKMQKQQESQKRIKFLKGAFNSVVVVAVVLGIGFFGYDLINKSSEENVDVGSVATKTFNNTEKEKSNVDVALSDEKFEVAALPIPDAPLYASENTVQLAPATEDEKQKAFEAMQKAVKDGKKVDVAIQDTIKNLDQKTIVQKVEQDPRSKVDTIQKPEVKVVDTTKQERVVVETPKTEKVVKDPVVASVNEELNGEEILLTAQREQEAYNEKHLNEVAPINSASTEKEIEVAVDTVKEEQVESVKVDSSVNNEKNAPSASNKEQVVVANEVKEEIKKEKVPAELQKTADTMKVPEAQSYVLRFTFTGDCWIGLYQGEKTLVNHVYGKGGVAEVTLETLPAKLKIGAPEFISASVNGQNIDLSYARPKSPFRVDITN